MIYNHHKLMAIVTLQVMALPAMDVSYLRDHHSVIIYLLANVLNTTLQQAAHEGGSMSEAAADRAAAAQLKYQGDSNSNSCCEGQEQPSPGSIHDAMVLGTPVGSAPICVMATSSSAPGSRGAAPPDEPMHTPTAGGQTPQTAPTGGNLLSVAAAADLDQTTLAGMVSLLVRLCWDAGRLWNNPPAVDQPDSEHSSDVVTVREALGTIHKLLEAYPKMYPTFLADARYVSMPNVTACNIDDSIGFVRYLHGTMHHVFMPSYLLINTSSRACCFSTVCRLLRYLATCSLRLDELLILWQVAICSTTCISIKLCMVLFCRAGMMVQAVLLNPCYSNMRAHAKELLHRICLVQSASEAHLWLLQQLAGMQKDAVVNPTMCLDFYDLFVKVCRARTGIMSIS